MSLFSTGDSDGSAGLGEPVNTVPAYAWRALHRAAVRHGCASVGELIAAAGPRGRGFGDDMPPEHAHRN